MSAAQLRHYHELSEKLYDLQREHRSLMAKVIKKTISVDEAVRLREVIQLFNKLHGDRKKLEDDNPLLPDNVLKTQSKK